MFWEFAVVSPIKDAAGKTTHYVAIKENITPRKAAEEQLRQSEQRFRLLLDSAPQGIYGVDLQGNCTFVNPAALELFGYEQEAGLLGRHIHEVVHHTRPDGTPCPTKECCGKECRLYQVLMDRAGRHVTEERFWHRDGQRTGFDRGELHPGQPPY